jgi:hypothetical protein
MRDLLFDTPWWLFTLIGIVGISLVMSGNGRQNKGTLRAGIAVLLVGVLLGVLSYLVDTPKEKVLKGTHALVDAAVTRDKATLAANLHPNASLAGWDRQQIIDGAVRYAEQFGLKSATITGTVRVMATFQGKDLPYDNVPTDWQLDWWETSDGKWLLKNITPMGSGNLSGGQMSKQYFNGSQ